MLHRLFSSALTSFLAHPSLHAPKNMLVVRGGICGVVKGRRFRCWATAVREESKVDRLLAVPYAWPAAHPGAISRSMNPIFVFSVNTRSN